MQMLQQEQQVEHSFNPWCLFLLCIWASLPKKRKCTVSHTVTSADADTPAPTQMDPDVKFADQVPSPVAYCKLHFLANFKSAAMADV